MALRERYCAPEHAFFQEVGDAGSRSSVYADAVAMNMWLSRGYALTGFEVKASRGDWLRELKKPSKAEPIISRCDHFYLVAPDDVYQIDEVPSTWGILHFRDGALREKRKAPALEPRPITRSFVAQMMRRACEQETRDISSAVDKALREDRDSMQRRVEDAVKSRTRLLQEKSDKWEQFCEKLGIDEWSQPEEVERALKIVLKCGIDGTYSGLRDLKSRLNAASARIAGALETLGITEEEEVICKGASE